MCWLLVDLLTMTSYIEQSSRNVHGQKTQDCVSQADPLPCFDVPSYSIHIDCGTHVQFHHAALIRQLILVASHATDSPGALHSPWQKVTASEQTTPKFIYFYTPYWGASSEVWQAEVDYLSVHFAGQSEKWEHNMEHYLDMRNLWHSDCTFSPCLAFDSARLVK